MNIFVLMPLAADYDDIFIYGIRRAAERCGFICTRSDQIEHDGDVLREIVSRIESADLLIAELSEENPNVFYEVGLAHAKDKPVILLAKRGTDLPFDLRGKRYIFYTSIHELEERLMARLAAMSSDK